jgi:tetratricopeptide (TPR) repeat protein
MTQDISGEHPGREVFRRLLGGEATLPESREAVRHLLIGCPECVRTVREERQAPPPQDYDTMFDRLEQRLAERGPEGLREQESAHRLSRELFAHEAVEALVQVHSTRRYASLALGELLLRQGRALVESGAAGPAFRTVRLAAAVLEQLDLEVYGAPVVQDTRAVAWAYLADADQRVEDLRTAETSVRLVRGLRAAAGADPALGSQLLGVEASLQAFAGLPDQAARRLTQAAAFHRHIGDRHALGRILLRKGIAFGNGGRPELAVRTLRRGMDLIDPGREPRLAVCGIHNLAWLHHEMGDTTVSADCMDGARHLYERAGDRADLARLRWLEGKLARRFDEAEGALVESRETLAREGFPYEASLASMDLAVLYTAERRGASMRRQANAMLPLFRSEAMHRETLLALVSYQQDSDPEALVGDLAKHLRRAWRERNPASLASQLGTPGRALPAPPL